MRGILRAFTSHPDTVGENYLEHMGSAFSFGLRLLGAGLACLIHGVFPFLCVKTGSGAVSELHTRMVTHRDKRARRDVAPVLREGA
ncbi:MAG: DUF6356 family protein [Pseudomonadota bacterium]